MAPGFKAMMFVSSLLAALGATGSMWVFLEWVTQVRPKRVPAGLQVPLLFKLFLPFARGLAPWFRRRDLENVLNRTDEQLVQAGRDEQMAPEEFLALRMIYAVVFLVLGLAFMGTGLRILVAFGCILLLFGALFPVYWLRSQVAVRHRSMQRALPDVLDLMTLSVEAGRDFLTALREILQQRGADPLGEELERVFREIQLGTQRRVALRNMAGRVRQEDVTVVVETLAQADELGVSIGQILRILGDQMRQKRFQRAEKLANESPVKLLLPLFLFIFPAVIIVMMGPVLLRSLQFFMR